MRNDLLSPALTSPGLLDKCIAGLQGNTLTTLDTTRNLLSKLQSERIIKALENNTSLTALRTILLTDHVELLIKILVSNKTLVYLDLSSSFVSPEAYRKLADFMGNHNTTECLLPKIQHGEYSAYIPPHNTNQKVQQTQNLPEAKPPLQKLPILRVLTGAAFGALAGLVVLYALRARTNQPQDIMSSAGIIVLPTLVFAGLGYWSAPTSSEAGSPTPSKS